MKVFELFDSGNHNNNINNKLYNNSSNCFLLYFPNINQIIANTIKNGEK